MSKKEHDAVAAALRTQMTTFDKPWFRSTSEVLKRRKLRGLNCLDLCSGNCEYSQVLRDEYNMSVTCADYIPSHLQQAVDEGFPTIEVDIDASSEEVSRIASAYAQKFDIVINLAAIEHIFNSDNLLGFIHTVLKPGGLVLINTPNIGFLAYRLYSLFGGNRPFGAGHHIRFWDFRFLRTNLFLNGFDVVEDARNFYSLPQDAMQRAFRNRIWLANIVSWLFHFCSIFKHVPFMKGLCSDELTVLARKTDALPTGFSLSSVGGTLEKFKGTTERQQMILRLKQARKAGWLDEHLYLAKLVDELEN